MLLLGAALFVKAIRLAGLVGRKACADAAAGLFGHRKPSICMLTGTGLRRADKAYEALTFTQTVDGMQGHTRTGQQDGRQQQIEGKPCFPFFHEGNIYETKVQSFGNRSNYNFWLPGSGAFSLSLSH